MSNLIDATISPDELYEEKQFTDMKAGGIKAFIPINPDGTPDDSRNAIYIAITNIDAGNGTLFPVHSKMEDCTTLEQALIDFKPSLDETLQQMMDEAEKREQSEQKNDGRIITLDQVSPQG